MDPLSQFSLTGQLNCTGLSADKWRDLARLRYNYKPQDMQDHCDGYNNRMTVEHVMSCKTGGLVTARHDVVQDQWHDLYANATSQGKCTHKQTQNKYVCGKTSESSSQRHINSYCNITMIGCHHWTRGYKLLRVLDCETWCHIWCVHHRHWCRIII